MYEVELKYRLTESSELETRLATMGFVPLDPITQVDRYYQHPSRNFVETDEALRIRQTETETRLTYKGPKVDTTTKTRREIELPLAGIEHPDAQWDTLLRALGFVPTLVVRKSRSEGYLNWEGGPVTVSLDEVEGLGRFVELERVCSEADRKSTGESLLRLAEHLGLKDLERRGYAQLMTSRE
jgi:adenylate cyclase class 2